MLTPLKDNITLVLAADMAARTYIEDLGPGNIFLTSYEFFDRRGKAGSKLSEGVAQALNCVKCLSLWLALAMILLRSVSRPLYLLITVPLAVSRVVTWLTDVSEFFSPNPSDLTRP
jgi:hypothetical protein